MRRYQQKNSKALLYSSLCQVLIIAALASGCVSRRIDSDDSPTDDTSKDKKIETLTSALSRAQSRIEELDAKVSAMSDKLEQTKVALDNMSGNKPIKTEAVGSAKQPDPATQLEDAHPVVKATSSEGRRLLKMDGAVVDFTKALAPFKAGKYSDSELLFNKFTEKYPEHILAGSAQFYAGESYYLMGEYKLALNEYGKVVSSFASSPRVASAMVRMAHCYDAVGNKSEGARTMALAKDLFEGNPSLDWPGNTNTPAAAMQKAEIKSEILPPAKLHAIEKAAAPNRTTHAIQAGNLGDRAEGAKKELDAAPMEPSEEPKAHKTE
jgi:TolA-binding protein